MLKTERKRYYKVKAGQTLASVAAHFGVTAYRLAAENSLTEPLYAGQVLRIPISRGIYTVQAGDTKGLVCGGEGAYAERNGTDVFYPGMKASL